MAGPDKRQWARQAALLAVGLPLVHVPVVLQPVSWDCGPGYHKPRFGRCVPDPGISLSRSSRDAVGRADRPMHGRLPAPIRAMAPWGPTLRS